MGRGRSLAGDRGTAEDADQQEDILPQRPVMRCVGCGAPTDRLQGVCRKCLVWHLRLDAIARSQEIANACGGAAVLPVVLDLAGVTR